jgi:hypothetical protein
MKGRNGTMLLWKYTQIQNPVLSRTLIFPRGSGKEWVALKLLL